MRLINGEKGKSYIVKSISITENLKRRLEMLGMTDGSQISVLNKKHGGSMVVKIRGTRFAIGSAISNAVELGGESSCRKQ